MTGPSSEYPNFKNVELATRYSVLRAKLSLLDEIDRAAEPRTIAWDDERDMQIAAYRPSGLVGKPAESREALETQLAQVTATMHDLPPVALTDIDGMNISFYGSDIIGIFGEKMDDGSRFSAMNSAASYIIEQVQSTE